MYNIQLLILYVSILGIFMISSKLIYKKICLPNVIFTILWSFAGVSSMYNNLGLIKPSIKVHAYIISIITIFNISYFLLHGNIFNIKKVKAKINYNKYKYSINYKLIYYMALVSFILILPNFIKAVQIIISYGFSMDIIRSEVYMAISNSGSHIYAFLTKNIPQAVFEAISIIGATEIVKGNYRMKWIVILSILIPTVTFGGRYAILNFIIFYIASYLVLKGRVKIKIKKRYITIGLTLLISMTISRGLNGMSILDMIINYFAGSFSYLQLIIDNPDVFGLNEPLLYGYITLGFIFEPIVMALKLILGVNIDIPGYHINIYTQQFVNIAENGFKLFNNNTSIIYPFIRDFGEIGILIGTIFIVLLIYLSESKYKKNEDLRWLFLLIYMYSVIINSTMMYMLTSIHSSLVIITIVISTKKYVVYNENNEGVLDKYEKNFKKCI